MKIRYPALSLEPSTRIAQSNQRECLGAVALTPVRLRGQSVWSLIHALTFNLPEVVSEMQLQVLQSLPLWLRQHLS